MSLADQILNADDIRRLPVSAPEWGLADGTLFVQTLDCTQRDSYEMSTVFNPDGSKLSSEEKFGFLRARLVVRALVDKDGNRVFRDEQTEVLSKKSSIPMLRIYDQAKKLNPLTDEELADLAKNCGAAQGGSSPSA